MNTLEQYFKCPRVLLDTLEHAPASEGAEGYFSFGTGNVCYGRSSKGYRRKRADQQLYDVGGDLVSDSGRVLLPFDYDAVIENLSHERYMRNGKSALLDFATNIVRHSYYAARPLLPLAFRSHLQKLYLSDWQHLTFPKWPVDTTIDDMMTKVLGLLLQAEGTQSIPFIWFWPNGADSCAIMTHDVEEEPGRAFCSTLMDINDEFHIPASFQVVPEKRYKVTSNYIQEIKSRGFEVNVQDLDHDGRLFWDLEKFRRRAAKINQYGREYNAKGFRAGILYRNQEWFDLLDFEYDMSTPNVAHLDPQRGGCCTVLPFFIGGLLELPVTTSQDHSIFHILHDYSLDLWRQQMAKIREHNGLISFIIHPDYIIEERARSVYRALLSELCRLRQNENVWIALPGEVNRWWRDRNEMTLDYCDGKWVVKGRGSDKACVAFASLQDGKVMYSTGDRRARGTFKSNILEKQLDLL